MSITELMDDPAFRTIIDRFVTEVPNRVGNLRAAIEGGQFAEAQRLAHQLKGAGGSFGFPSITTTAGAVETRCMQRELDPELLESMDRLEMACEQVTSEWSMAAAAT